MDSFTLNWMMESSSVAVENCFQFSQFQFFSIKNDEKEWKKKKHVHWKEQSETVKSPDSHLVDNNLVKYCGAGNCG